MLRVAGASVLARRMWRDRVEMQGVEPCSTLLRLAGFQCVETIPIPFAVPVPQPFRVAPIILQIPPMPRVLLPLEPALVSTHS